MVCGLGLGRSYFVYGVCVGGGEQVVLVLRGCYMEEMCLDDWIGIFWIVAIMVSGGVFGYALIYHAEWWCTRPWVWCRQYADSATWYHDCPVCYKMMNGGECGYFQEYACKNHYEFCFDCGYFEVRIGERWWAFNEYDMDACFIEIKCVARLLALEGKCHEVVEEESAAVGEDLWW